MSLFKLKSLWSKVFSGEQFDERHLAVGKIGRLASIAVGNFQGILRVYLIYKNTEIDVRNIYENKFQNAIIDVKYVSHPDERLRHGTIGILFFRKFAYLHFQPVGNGQVFEPKLVYVEVQPSFAIGVSPLSVMTLNSTIQYLNPPEIQKIKIGDPIYPFTRSMDKIYFVDGEELVEIEGSTEQWRIIVGRIRQLFVFVDTIVVIGERALWQVSDAKILKTKVMEEDIACGTITFRNVTSYNIMVANFNGLLFIYSSDYELLWAIKLDYVPLKIIVHDHENIKGMLTILSQEGNLQCAYSGVQIPDTVIEPLSENINYSVVDAQIQSFLERMKTKPDQKISKMEAIEDAQVNYKLYFTQIEKSYQNLNQKQKLFQIQNKLVKSQLVCQITSKQSLRNFKVQINVPYNMFCRQNSKQLRVAKVNDKIIFDMFTNNESFPYERELSVIVRYQNNEQRGAPFIKMNTVPIPMGLQSIVTGYQSNAKAANNIIIKSNSELPSFNQIFPELCGKEGQQQRKTLKLTLSNGVDCIITYNKAYNKAKIESQYYSGLCYIISEFSNHIRLYNSRKKSKIELSVEIPLQQFFIIMKQHYEQRIILKQAFKNVQLKSEQFRNTQKKLLIKMKQKMTNMGNIDKLLQYTYERLIESANHFEEVSKQTEVVNHNLCVAIKLIIQLLFIRANPSAKAKNMALGILGYEQQNLQRGWQDKVIANSSHFLNKKYNSGDQVSFQQLQKIPLYVISKVNNGDWN